MKIICFIVKSLLVIRIMFHTTTIVPNGETVFYKYLKHNIYADD